MRRDELSLPEPPATDRPGDRWECGYNNPEAPCSRGPDGKGVCPLAESCHPRRTWQGRRKQWSLITALLLVVTVFFAAQSQRDAAIFKPGDLSTPHAQILAGTLTSQRCGSCHPQAASSALQWFSSAASEHPQVTQSDRCLDCHHKTIDRETAMMAHNLPRRARAEIRLASTGNFPADAKIAGSTVDRSWRRLLPGPAVDQEDVACSACHREHHGADGDLLAISDSQCQTCHNRRFGSFADAHPGWGRWPYGRGGEVSFNHASHAQKHFPGTIRGSQPAPFQCVDCHPRTGNNELVRSTSYQRACAACHDQPLGVQAADGLELLALPSLSESSAEQVQPWPASATGFYDGKLSPLAELLLRADAETASALRRLPEKDFSQIDSDNIELAAVGEIIARSHRTLLQQIASDGQQAVVDRTIRLGVKQQTVWSVFGSLSPQLVSEAERRWFNNNEARSDESNSDQQPSQEQEPNENGADDPGSLKLSDDLASDDLLGLDDPLVSDPLQSDPLQSDPLQSDPLAGDPLAGDVDRADRRFDAETMMPGGGWYVDDVRMAIGYRGRGHEDAVLKAVIELISQLPQGDPTRRGLLGTGAIASCVECHPGAISSQPSWKSRPQVGRRDSLTKFSHGPHVNVAQLADCQYCHTIPSPDHTTVHLTSTPLEPATGIEFAPLGRQACSACHVPQGAGDACITCHKYHGK